MVKIRAAFNLYHKANECVYMWKMPSPLTSLTVSLSPLSLARLVSFSFTLSRSLLSRLLYVWHNKCSSVLLLLLAVAVVPFGAIPVGRRFWVVCMHAMDVKFFFSLVRLFFLLLLLLLSLCCLLLLLLFLSSLVRRMDRAN